MFLNYATSLKIAGTDHDVTGFFSLPNPSSCIMALGPIKTVTEMGTKNLLWG